MRFCHAFQIIVLLAVAPCSAADLEWVKVSNDGKGFVLAESGKQFVPWGFNYDHEGDGQLIEDYWDDKWPTVESASSRSFWYADGVILGARNASGLSARPFLS